MTEPTRIEKEVLGHVTAIRAVVTVGDGGRGFVVEGVNFIGGRERYVITAAHCLPERDGQRLPPPHGLSHTVERTYPKLLGPLGEQPTVWCECLFVDPIADIAVLGSPDCEVRSEEAEACEGEEAEAYEALVEAATSLTVAEPPSQPIPEEVAQLAELAKLARRRCRAFLLPLTNQWFACTVEHKPNGMLNVVDADHGIASGMSGSPIIATRHHKKSYEGMTSEEYRAALDKLGLSIVGSAEYLGLSRRQSHNRAFIFTIEGGALGG